MLAERERARVRDEQATACEVRSSKRQHLRAYVQCARCSVSVPPTLFPSRRESPPSTRVRLVLPPADSPQSMHRLPSLAAIVSSSEALRASSPVRVLHYGWDADVPVWPLSRRTSALRRGGMQSRALRVMRWRRHKRRLLVLGTSKAAPRPRLYNAHRPVWYERPHAMSS